MDIIDCFLCCACILFCLSKKVSVSSWLYSVLCPVQYQFSQSVPSLSSVATIFQEKAIVFLISFYFVLGLFSMPVIGPWALPENNFQVKNYICFSVECFKLLWIRHLFLFLFFKFFILVACNVLWFYRGIPCKCK